MLISFCFDAVLSLNDVQCFMQQHQMDKINNNNMVTNKKVHKI